MSDAKAKDGELDANVEKAESKLSNAEDIERDKPETFEAFEEIKAFNDDLNNAIDISNKYSVELEALKEKLENARLAKDESGKQLFAAQINLYSAQKDYDDLLAIRNRRPKHRAPANKDKHDEPNLSKKDDKQLALKIPENNPLVEKQNDSMGKIESNDNAMDKPIKIDNTIKKRQYS